MAVVSAVVAFLTLSPSQDQLSRMVQTTLPAVASAQALSIEAQLFISLSDRLARVTNEAEHDELHEAVFQRMENLTQGVDQLKGHPFPDHMLAKMRRQAQQLTENVKKADDLAHDYLDAQKLVNQALIELDKKQTDFVQAARSRISAGYREFYDSGNNLGNKLRQALQEVGKKPKEKDLRDLDKEIRIGMGTLINREAGEMRANMEMLATVQHLAGLMREAAQTDEPEMVKELSTSFKAAHQTLMRIRLILSTGQLASREVLIKGLQVTALGVEPQSIFQLRLNQLNARYQARKVAGFNQQVAHEFTQSVSNLVTRAQNEAGRDSALLRERWSETRLLLAIAAILAVVAVLLIGWLYVGRNVISRLRSLSLAMEQQAKGKDAPIPQGGDDEIGDMAQALRLFVEQRQKAESALKESAERFRLLAEISPYPVVMGSSQGDIDYISPNFSEFFGYTPSDLPNRETLLMSLFPDPIERPELSNPPAAPPMEYTAAMQEQELRVTCKDGSLKDVILHNLELPGGGFYLIAQDVTEQRQAQSRKLMQEKLTSAVETAGAVCHELNQPLQIVMSRVEILQMRYSQDQELAEHLSELTREFKRMTQLTQRLQNLTRYRTKEYVEDVKILDLDRSADT